MSGFHADGEEASGVLAPRQSEAVPSPYQRLIESPVAHRVYLVELYPYAQEIPG